MKNWFEYLFETACDIAAQDIFDRYGFIPGSYPYGGLMIFVYNVLCEFDRMLHSDDFIENVFDDCAKYCGFDVSNIPEAFYDDFYKFMDLTGFVEKDEEKEVNDD